MEITAPQHILVVEDDPDIAQVARLILEKEGYGVTLAADAIAALATIALDRPDLILTDVMMPGVDGLHFLWALKHAPETADIPVMVMSALTEDADAQRGHAVGAEYYLKKPFERSQLVAAVKGVFALVQKKQMLSI